MRVSVYVFVGRYLSNEITFDLNTSHSDSSRPFLGQVRMSQRDGHSSRSRVEKRAKWRECVSILYHFCVSVCETGLM